MERAAAAFLALDPDPAAHAFDQPGRDAQAQAGAAVLARRRSVGLLERLEDVRLLVRGNADAGVLHLEVQRRRCSRRSVAVLGERHAQRDAARRA